MIDNSSQTDLKIQENVIVNITSNSFEKILIHSLINTQIELSGNSLNINKAKSIPHSQYNNQFHSFNKKVDN